MSVHLGESPKETEFLAAGTGPWRGMLEFVGAWRDDWAVPGCTPVEYLDRLGVSAGRQQFRDVFNNCGQVNLSCSSVL